LKFQFGVVIDAGSSHSSFYVFKWQNNDELLVVPYSLELVHRCRQEGIEPITNKMF